MPRRVYGYMKRSVCGSRYQDGFNAQSKSDKPLEVEGEDKFAGAAATVVVDDTDEEEIIDIHPKTEALLNEPVVPEPVAPTPNDTVSDFAGMSNVNTLDSDNNNDETGGLPSSMTSFMSMDTKVGETTPEEADEAAE